MATLHRPGPKYPQPTLPYVDTIPPEPQTPPQIARLNEHELRALLADNTGLDVDAVPHALAFPRFVHAWRAFLRMHCETLKRRPDRLAMQLQLQLLAGFPWPLHASAYDSKKSDDSKILADSRKVLRNPADFAVRIILARARCGATWYCDDHDFFTQYTKPVPYYDPAACVWQSVRHSYFTVFPLRNQRLHCYRRYALVIKTSRGEREIHSDSRIDTVVGYIADKAPEGSEAFAPGDDPADEHTAEDPC